MNGKVGMNDREIIKLLEILIGSTEAVGDSAIDNKIEINLKTLIDVANWCMDGVSQSASTRHRKEYSMSKIGERAFFCSLRMGRMAERKDTSRIT